MQFLAPTIQIVAILEEHFQIFSSSIAKWNEILLFLKHFLRYLAPALEIVTVLEEKCPTFSSIVAKWHGILLFMQQIFRYLSEMSQFGSNSSDF